MDMKIVMVEPEYDANVGYVCRVMKNFGCGAGSLLLINPKCPLGFEAVQFSKHAREILGSAKLFPDLASALSAPENRCASVVGTTGVQKRNKDAVRTILPLSKAAPLIRKKRSVILLLGREGIGLRPEELNRCDLLLTIPANPAYPIMNISHALAVILYALSLKAAGRTAEEGCPKKKRDALLRAFSSIAGSEPFRRSGLAPSAFRKIIARAEPTEQEADLLLGVLSRASKRPKSR
ncbi:MAG: RNA methyltransferase [Candidatus Bilamarchaeaceae archaeon]